MLNKGFPATAQFIDDNGQPFTRRVNILAFDLTGESLLAKVEFTDAPGQTMMHVDFLTPTAEPTVQRDADLFRHLRNLMGYVENGTADTVALYQDDATREYSVRVGKTTNSGEYLAQAIMKHPRVEH